METEHFKRKLENEITNSISGILEGGDLLATQGNALTLISGTNDAMLSFKRSTYIIPNFITNLK